LAEEKIITEKERLEALPPHVRTKLMEREKVRAKNKKAAH